MKPPDQFDSEFLTLISLAPTLDDFQKQIRESRWTAIVIATIFLACGVGFMYTADPPNLERKWWLGFGFAAISVPAIIFSLLAPARWIRSMSLTQTSEIEEILANEKTSKNETVDLWKEVAVILLIFLPLMLVGFSIWNHFGSTWGLVFLVPLMLIVVARHFYMGHRDSAQFAAALDRAFKSSPYKTTGSYVASWADDSFVKQDNSFQLLKAWQHKIDLGIITWCRFSNSGSGMSSGVAGVGMFYDPPEMRVVVKQLREISSMHYDASTNSLYGTFLTPLSGEKSFLAGLPWQIRKGQIVIRLDQTILAGMNKNGEITTDAGIGAIRSFETLFQSLETDDAGSLASRA